MFCSNCGYNLNGDEQFCTNCGMKIESKEVKIEEKVTEPVFEPVAESIVEPAETELLAEEQTTVLTNDAYTESIEQEPVVQKYEAQNYTVQNYVQEEAPVPPKKKKGKNGLLLGIGIAAIIVALLTVLVALNYPTVKNFVKKTVSSDEEYFRYVHTEKSNDMVASLSKALSNLSETPKDLSSVLTGTSNMKVKLNKPIFDLLKQYAAGSGVSLDWLTGAAAEMDVAIGEGNKIGMDVGLILNEKNIATGNVILDAEAGKLYFALPDLNNQYVCMDLGGALNNNQPTMTPNDSYISGGMGYYSATPTMVPSTPSSVLESIDITAFTKHLPEEKELENLINKYIGLILNNIEEVEKENDTIDIGALTCKCTVYTVDVDDELVEKVFKAIFTELKDDEVVKNYIINTANELGEDGKEVYSDFKDSIKIALSNLDDVEVEDFEYSIWVDPNGKTVALEVKIDTFKATYKNIEKGNKFASELSIGDKESKFGFVNEGEKVDGNIKSMTAFKMNGTSYVELESSRVDPSNLKEDEFKGSVTISLGQGLRDMIKMSGNEALAMFNDAELVIDCDITGNSTKMKLAINMKSEEWCTIESEMNLGEKPEVKVPASYVNGTLEQELQKWVKGLNFDKVFNNLSEAKVPNMLISELRKAANQLKY